MYLLTGEQVRDLLHDERVAKAKTNYGMVLVTVATEKHPEIVQPLLGTEVDCRNNHRQINPFLKRISEPAIHEAIDMDFY